MLSRIWKVGSVLPRFRGLSLQMRIPLQSAVNWDNDLQKTRCFRILHRDFASNPRSKEPVNKKKQLRIMSKIKLQELDIVRFLKDFEGEIDAQDIRKMIHSSTEKKSMKMSDDTLMCFLTILENNKKAKLNSRFVSKCFQGMLLFNNDRSSQRILQMWIQHLDGILMRESDQTHLDCIAMGQCFFGFHSTPPDQEGVNVLMKTLTAKLITSRIEWKCANIAHGMYGLKNMNCREIPCITEILKEFREKIEDNEEDWTSREIGDVLYGLQSMHSDDPEVKGILAAILIKMEANEKEYELYSIGNALYGLQHMSTDLDDVKIILAVLTQKLDETTGQFSFMSLGNTLCGMQNMSSEVEQVRAFLSAVARKCELSTFYGNQTMSSTAIGNSLGGLQNMSSDAPEVREVLAALEKKMKQGTRPINGEAVGRALFGMKCMKSDNAEVRSVLLCLSQTMDKKFEGSFTGQDTADALFGLQCMTTEDEEVRVFLSIMARKLERNSEAMTAEQISRALYGLQGMKSTVLETREIVEVLTKKLEENDEDWNGREVSNALYGLQNMSSGLLEAEMSELIAQITKKIGRGITLGEEGLGHWMGVEIGNALYGLKSMSSESVVTHRLLSALSMKIEECPDDFMDTSSLSKALHGLQKMSSEEKNVAKVLSALTKKMEANPDIWSAEEIGDALFGFQSMESGSAEVKGVLTAISKAIDNMEELMSVEVLSKALYGLTGMSGEEEEVRAVLSAIMRKTEVSDGSVALVGPTVLGDILYGLMCLQKGSESVLEIDNVLTKVLNSIDQLLGDKKIRKTSIPDLRHLQTCMKFFDFFSKDKSTSIDLPRRISELDEALKRRETGIEDQVYHVGLAGRYTRSINYLIAAQNDKNVEEYKTSANEMMDGCIEGDIVIKRSSSDSSSSSGSGSGAVVEKKYNVEIDGPLQIDFQTTTKRWNKYRDEYLTSGLGFPVVRIKVDGTLSKDTVEIKKTAREALIEMELLDSTVVYV